VRVLRVLRRRLMRNGGMHGAAAAASEPEPAPANPLPQIRPTMHEEASQPLVEDDDDDRAEPPSHQPSNSSSSNRARLIQLLHMAARKATKEQDPWKHRSIDRIPAERVRRWFYNRSNDSWHSDETIVKMEPAPFTKGAMRSCFRLKKRAVLPQSASNTRFHNCNWSTSALNYVAKAYMCPSTQQIDVSLRAKAQVKNDIVLQHEAQHWATKFNDRDPPTRILFLRSYTLEFVDRPGTPWLALERFITGRDAYGASFVKHNTNSGFVDVELRRVTPQVFSAFSFYASHGSRTNVASIHK
jgi:elongation factor 2 kinase